MKLLLYLFVIGQEEVCLIKVKDYGEDLLSKLQRVKKSSILEIQVIVTFLSNLVIFLEVLICVSYLLEHTNLDNY